MGTDISMYAEVRRQGQWLLAEPLEVNAHWEEDVDIFGPRMIPRSLYSTRNYELFAVLANMRNPIRSVTPFDYLSDPRGLPADLSPQLLDHHNAWADECFAESWLLLEELEAFDWHGKEIQRRGVVDPAAAHLFPTGRRGFPLSEWPEEIPMMVADRGRGVEVTWTETYAEAVGKEFLLRTLRTLRSYGPPQDVRIVFWFTA